MNSSRNYKRLPEWLKVPMPVGPNYIETRNLLQGLGLNTVCEEARCPNIGDCWERKTATFMILGDICTRACRYCAVTSGKPGALDPKEPEKIAQAVAVLDLDYVVITSVDRDDLPDGGASVFANCIESIRQLAPNCKIEILTPDFGGNFESLKVVLDAGPTVLNHNIETVRSIFATVRPKGDYDLSLEFLRRSKEIDPGIATKSGIMVGLGEGRAELGQTMLDLSEQGVDFLTVGQYLRPSVKHIEMSRFYHPSEFKDIEEEGRKLGFLNVASGPLIRSSYHADELHTPSTAR